MTLPKKLASYQAVAVETASPGKLILMLLDGALRFLRTAEEAFELPQLRERQEAIHNNLIKAQNIILELQRCLNLREGGDFGITMFRLYDFMNTQLMEANMRKERDSIRTVQRLLSQIRDAWDQMLREQNTGVAAGASLSMSA